MTPNEKRLSALKDMTVHYKRDVAIDLVHTACHSYSFQSYRVGKLMIDKHAPLSENVIRQF